MAPKSRPRPADRRRTATSVVRAEDEIRWMAEAKLDRSGRRGDGGERPDIIEFALSDAYLDRPLYPVQGTLLKIWALQDELFTQFDHDMIGQWTESFRVTGDNGIQPDIYERIRQNKEDGRPWFKEWINVLGRRASKGFMGAIADAYVLWHMILKGDPQGHYGIARDKRLAMLVFASKKELAVKNLWGDVYNMLLGSRCFIDYLPPRTLKENLLVYTPNDWLRIRERENRGLEVSPESMASIEITPKESTVMASRGPAVFGLNFDEFAWITRQTSKADSCLAPDSRVLTMDLMWKPIGDIKPGDLLVGLEEEGEGTSQRKLVETKVVATSRNHQVPWKLTFDDGTSVVCSGNHRWLIYKHGSGGRWKPTINLRVGSKIRAFSDPWEQPSSYDAGYLAGFYDGEGWVLSPNRKFGRVGEAYTRGVGFTQIEGEISDKVAGTLSTLGFSLHKATIPTGVSGRAYGWKIAGGVEEQVRFLGTVRPSRLLNNHRWVWEGVAPRSRVKTIVKKERLGEEQELVDLETTTGTFIAEGLVSHNSELWTSATPATETFKKDAFIYEASSPWQMVGQFYENSRQALAISDGTMGFPEGMIMRPELMLVQLESWKTYEHWDQAHTIMTRPEPKKLFHPPHGCTYPRQRQAQMESPEVNVESRAKEIANPEGFRVEYRCLDPETRVLTEDLRWLPIKTLRPGDRLVSLEENPRTGGKRRLQVGVVQAVARQRGEAYRVLFDDGSSVICSDTHRWLSASAGSPGNYRWRALDLMKVGDHIKAVAEEGRALGHKAIVAIEKIPERELVDLQTSTGTFIAEGLVSHNSKWAMVLDAYLNPDNVDRMFAPWPEKQPINDGMKGFGFPNVDYYAHCDPSKVGKNTGFAIAHVVHVPGAPLPHVVFDLIKHWEPGQFEANNWEIDYEVLIEEFKVHIRNFMPNEFTFDQGYSAWMIQQLNKWIQGQRLPKRTNVYEKTAPQPLDAGVLTPGCWKQMGHIRVGDEVIGSDGKPHKVVGVHPRGVEKVYRVTFSDGGQAECTADHPWGVRKRGRGQHLDGLEVRTLQEMMDAGLRFPSGPSRWAVPNVAPVQFAPLEKPLPIDPYLLGVILGDGCLGPHVTIATSLEDVKEQEKLLAMVAPEGTVVSSRTWKRGDNKWGTVRIAGGPGRRASPLLDAIRELGLYGRRGKDKFVPEPYLWASVEERLALLQGLLDSDGTSTSPNGSHRVMFSSISENLRDAVVFLTRSLGGTSKVKQYGSRTPEVLVSGLPRGMTPFRLSRKALAYQPKGMTPFRLSRKALAYQPKRLMDHRFIVGVEEVGMKPVQCISVDVPDHLYVTDDFLLTHNTFARNWEVAEVFKVALNLGCIHAPHYPLLEQELKFLQVTGDRKVDHPTVGDVQTKDIYDAVSQTVHGLIGKRVAALLGEQLMDVGIRPTMAGGLPMPAVAPGPQKAPVTEVAAQMMAFNSRRGGPHQRPMPLPARGGRFYPTRRRP